MIGDRRVARVQSAVGWLRGNAGEWAGAVGRRANGNDRLYGYMRDQVVVARGGSTRQAKQKITHYWR